MNLRGIDLNLLVVLDALLDEAHVSRAADRLNLSQPAATAALQRCRRLFRDPLLERGRGTMRLTAKAQALRAPLKTVLAGVNDLVDPPRLPLAEARGMLRIEMADYPALVVIAPLQQALQRTAPGVDLVIQPWRGAEAARQGLVEGSTDIAISVFPAGDDDLHREEVLTEHYVVAMRSGHPAAAGFDLAAWLRYPHVVVSGRGATRAPLDAELTRRGLSRRVGVVVPSFQMVPPLLAGSDMIAMLPSRVAAAAEDVVRLPPPIPVEGFPLHLAWHPRRSGDEVLRHVAGLLVALLR